MIYIVIIACFIITLICWAFYFLIKKNAKLKEQMEIMEENAKDFDDTYKIIAATRTANVDDLANELRHKNNKNS